MQANAKEHAAALGMHDTTAVYVRLAKVMLLSSDSSDDVLCESGGVVKPHLDDAPRSTDCFATLVVQLPAQFEGGMIFIHHRDVQSVFDFVSGSDEAIFTATYLNGCLLDASPLRFGFLFMAVYGVV